MTLLSIKIDYRQTLFQVPIDNENAQNKYYDVWNHGEFHLIVYGPCDNH